MDPALPAVVPMISYENAAKAIEWLCRVFGFVEQSRMAEADGRITHAELRLNNAVIFLASPSPAYQSPDHHAEHCAAAKAWQESPWVIDGVLVFVNDVEAHFRRARAGGAALLSDVEIGYPAKRYRVKDCEGHRWMFMQR
ncbi:MAG: hypothetical protein QM770_03565 [Tepidisphaeraceae bacterium]